MVLYLYVQERQEDSFVFRSYFVIRVLLFVTPLRVYIFVLDDLAISVSSNRDVYL